MTNNGMQVSDMNRLLTDYEKRVVDFAKAYHSGKKLTSEQLRTKAEIDRNNHISQIHEEIRKGLGYTQRSNHQQLVSETLKQIADVQARFGF